MRRKRTAFDHTDLRGFGPTPPRPKHRPYILKLISALLIWCGLYLLVLLIAPKLNVPFIKTPIDLDRSDDATDQRDRIQIEKISLEVPFYEGGEEALDRGAWHRYPDRGDPIKGGNFILSAHRFDIGTTPAQTKLRSPFYNLDKLKEGDAIRVYFRGEWFDYTVRRIYDVKPNAVEIEDASSSAKLTLYSCTLAGSADGRVVIEATKSD